MSFKKILLAPLLWFTFNASAQTVNNFYFVEPETKNLPVFIRGNLSSNKILLFVQGGSAENGIDFGRSDYPNWKNSLETKVAIAYFDQRGLNRPVNKIDTTKINSAQSLKDIISIAKSLKEKYHAEIYLFGHSNGGKKVLDCLALLTEDSKLIKAGIAFNTPITTDFSPERNTHYRPLYLKNLAKKFIEEKKDTTYWQEALDWMTKTDSIYDRESSKQWNLYVDKAYNPTKRKTTVGMAFKVIFSKPYNPVKYLNKKDNQCVADILWEAERGLNHWELLSKINHPILLLSGRFDPIATLEEQEEANRIMPNSELVILSDCTHESFLDQPKLFEEAIFEFINS